MKITLTTDDGEVIDEIQVEEDRFSSAGDYYEDMNPDRFYWYELGPIKDAVEKTIDFHRRGKPIANRAEYEKSLKRI